MDCKDCKHMSEGQCMIAKCPLVMRKEAFDEAIEIARHHCKALDEIQSAVSGEGRAGGER